MKSFRSDITQALHQLKNGDDKAADLLFPLLYEELRGMAGNYMRYENRGHTLQPTSLVHEAYVKLIGQDDVDWQGRTHFLAVSAQAMRRILVDHARTKKRKKRGGDVHKVNVDDVDYKLLDPEVDEHVLAIDEALTLLEARDPFQAKIVEMRFFTGMTVQEVADAMGVSKRKIEAEWTMIKAWLRSNIHLEGK
ncbi:MAG: sigma-70 family RNA polymerase sigma factor [Bacteroidetes bacterium]|uniref:Sigma-70 family RNA polymerase sigma factor n=1 Tax=Phaeocystidibacter marisrubri TaxID=1577780 RepID=A0A6L3ZBS0_9FLAO|nr:sigma-70 family RNA polymerase sigma factor [Phaeocystidibacter marisrubri]KAB2815102.1 sigma-70 family RNA polymerase sigma factor [Phaeocystidibacter marisrubri]TNE27649.1 MAG: sigma-70 family RNA polymerase sigma factor [Bacteroidota bacterium]GGH70322.1 extracytoplasmic sigma factor ECF [Phaeocystidibacter marisrubri]